MLIEKKRPNVLAVAWLLTVTFLSSCATIDVYEKQVPLPGREWAGSFEPEFTFNIKDTAVPYQVYIILRHNDQYHFNNIWLNLYTKAPGDTLQKVPYELKLADNEKGWLGTSMDDLYEHRISLTPSSENLYFKKSGTYTFRLQQIMREDPLQNVMNVGLRIEKKGH